MKVRVHWIIDGIMEIDADTNEAAEALADEKLRSFINANPELTEILVPRLSKVMLSPMGMIISNLAKAIQQFADRLFKLIIIILDISDFLPQLFNTLFAFFHHVPNFFENCR